MRTVIIPALLLVLVGCTCCSKWTRRRDAQMRSRPQDTQVRYHITVDREPFRPEGREMPLWWYEEERQPLVVNGQEVPRDLVVGFSAEGRCSFWSNVLTPQGLEDMRQKIRKKIAEAADSPEEQANWAQFLKRYEEPRQPLFIRPDRQSTGTALVQLASGEVTVAEILPGGAFMQADILEYDPTMESGLLKIHVAVDLEHGGAAEYSGTLPFHVGDPIELKKSAEYQLMPVAPEAQKTRAADEAVTVEPAPTSPAADGPDEGSH